MKIERKRGGIDIPGIERPFIRWTFLKAVYNSGPTQ